MTRSGRNGGVNTSRRGGSNPSMRNGVESSGRKGMTAQQPPNGQGRTAQRAVGGNRHRGVLRACGQEFAASARVQRMQRRRKPAFVKGEEGEQNARHGAEGPGFSGAAAECFSDRAASDWACSRIRKTSRSSCAKSIVST